MCIMFRFGDKQFIASLKVFLQDILWALQQHPHAAFRSPYLTDMPIIEDYLSKTGPLVAVQHISDTP